MRKLAMSLKHTNYLTLLSDLYGRLPCLPWGILHISLPDSCFALSGVLAGTCILPTVCQTLSDFDLKETQLTQRPS